MEVIKNKKINLLYILILALMLIFMTGCFFKAETSIERLERITKYDLDNDMEELYYFHDSTFTGQAGQYCVYRLEDEPKFFQEIFDSKGDKEDSSKEVYDGNDMSESIKEQMNRTLSDSWKVPTEYHPNFENEYTYVIGYETTYFMYFKSDKLLMVFMQGH